MFSLFFIVQWYPNLKHLLQLLTYRLSVCFSVIPNLWDENGLMFRIKIYNIIYRFLRKGVTEWWLVMSFH